MPDRDASRRVSNASNGGARAARASERLLWDGDGPQMTAGAGALTSRKYLKIVVSFLRKEGTDAQARAHVGSRTWSR